MDLSLIVPRGGLRGESQRRDLACLLNSTGLEWELLVVGTGTPAGGVDPDSERIRDIADARAKGRFHRGFVASRGDWVIALESGCSTLTAEIPRILDEMQDGAPDLVLAFDPRGEGRRLGWRRRRGRAPVDIYGFRRGALEDLGVGAHTEHPMALLGRALERGMDVRSLTADGGGPLPADSLSRRWLPRPTPYVGSLGLLALLVGVVGSSVGGARWAFDPQVSYCGATMSLGLVALAGAQLTLFSYLFDHHQGLRLRTERSGPRS